METGLTGLMKLVFRYVELNPDKSAILAKLQPVERLFRVAQALRIGLTVDESTGPFNRPLVLRQVKSRLKLKRLLSTMEYQRTKKNFFN